ncbi:MAG: hypothetical protein K6E30_03330 [Lachnospiraceae bacterium]|nr:hypothetical protein [Lachnospiraceae bacterium]
MKLSEGLRTVFLVGVGAIAITGEKSKALIDELVKKGELTVEEGKILNEDMARKLNEKAEGLDEKVEKLKPENVARVFREAMADLDSMTKEARSALRAKLDELDAADEAAEEEGSGETETEEACGAEINLIPDEAPAEEEAPAVEIPIEEVSEEKAAEEEV